MEEVVLPETWKVLSLGDILVDNSKTIDPRKFPDQYFELYSVPHFTEGKPEILKGEEIGSSKKTVEKGSVLLCKINPRINRVWIVGEFTNHRKIASTEWIAFSKIEGLFNKYLFFYLQKSALRNYLAKNVSGVGGSLMRVNKTKVSSFPFFLPPLPEQHRIVAKIEELFSELDNGIANLEKAKAQLKVYRQAVLKSAFEGKLTEQWRSEQMGAGTLPSAEDLLARIQEERQKHYEQQLTEWREAVAEWEANGKDGRKPSNPKKPKEYPPLTEKEMGELPELPVGWQWVKLYKLADVVSGVTKGGRKLDGKETMMLPYLRVANVQDGFLDLSEVKEIEALPSDFQKYKLEYGDILYTEGGDKDKLGRGTIWKNEIPNCIHQNHIYRARLYSKEISNSFVGYFSQTQTAKKYFYGKAKQTVNLASINLTVLSNLPLPIPPEGEQHQIVQEIESRLSVCDHLEQEIETALLKSEALRQSILKKAFEGRLAPQDPNDEPARELLKRIKAKK